MWLDPGQQSGEWPMSLKGWRECEVEASCWKSSLVRRWERGKGGARQDQWVCGGGAPSPGSPSLHLLSPSGPHPGLPAVLNRKAKRRDCLGLTGRHLQGIRSHVMTRQDPWSSSPTPPTLRRRGWSLSRVRALHSGICCSRSGGTMNVLNTRKLTLQVTR